MKIDGETLQNLFKPGAALNGAAVFRADLYGENYADDSAEGCEIFFFTANGGAALLTLDTLETDGLAARFISTENEAEADEADRRRLAELEQQAEAIRRQYTALQAIHAAAQADAARRAETLDGLLD